MSTYHEWKNRRVEVSWPLTAVLSCSGSHHPTDVTRTSNDREIVEVQVNEVVLPYELSEKVAEWLMENFKDEIMSEPIPYVPQK